MRWPPVLAAAVKEDNKRIYPLQNVEALSFRLLFPFHFLNTKTTLTSIVKQSNG